MRLPQLALATSAALLLTACGGDDGGGDGGGNPFEGRTGEEVATAAADALEEAGAVHVEGTITQDAGQQLSVDLQLQGEDTAGTLTVEGLEVEIIAADGEQFLKADADFWTTSGVPAQAAALLDGRWVMAPAGDDFGDLTLAGIADSLRSPRSPILDELGEDELDGQPVVVVEQEDGARLYVARDDPAYPLRLERDGEEAGAMDFSGFGEEEDITAPADALDLEELAGSN